MTDLWQRLKVRFPIIQAPMAGGPSTPQLAAAVGQAGGLGFLGAAYLTGEQITRQVEQARALHGGPVGLNLFIESNAIPPDSGQVERAAAALWPFHAELGLPPATLPIRVSVPFEEQWEAVLNARPEVFSFTFGQLSAERVRRLQAQGTVVMGTATTVAEARALETTGVDAVIAQGSEAGGHRGTFLHPAEEALVGTLALVAQLVDAVRIPVIASGGIMDGRGIRAVLTLGAHGVQLGTAFLLTPEAGTSAPYRAALGRAQDHVTTLTRAFSGRLARGLSNRVTREFPQEALLPYPYQNALTRSMRSEASLQGRAEFLSLWAGQGAHLARDLPAGALVSTLAQEAGLSPVPGELR
ncbi:NAD(P)H-dependent flavin oxidoreductase [Deinococcus peraridilitoris]|uniref:Propionate 3-nitronate monooxygenase n=1 Tax=Deinococcus peraridilitoris (strain DSM 19664 / LMG 22246 / CIP 109416 / KR-200) TaxID=937777 RepID=L0A427_DEIPD|nr:nitronate monooxygenase [Deinococcus peraridilitoris]AFZ68628.1 2-nitropropane dioxygenase-like enzyme [Deinococcus peraridilitoris DSM 19664]